MQFPLSFFLSFSIYFIMLLPIVMPYNTKVLQRGQQLNVPRAWSSCYSAETPIRLSLAWGLNTQTREPYLSYIRKLADGGLTRIFERLNESFPGSSFGVFHFGSLLYAERKCRIISPLTTDLNAISESLKNEKYKAGSGYSEVSLHCSALISRATDMNWGPPTYFSEKSIHLRIIVIVADERSVSCPLSNPCYKKVTNLYPDGNNCLGYNISRDNYGEILQDNSVFTLNLVHPNVVSYWGPLLETLNEDYIPKKYMIQLDVNNMEKMIETLLNGIILTMCQEIPTVILPTGITPILPGTTSTTPTISTGTTTPTISTGTTTPTISTGTTTRRISTCTKTRRISTCTTTRTTTATVRSTNTEVFITTPAATKGKSSHKALILGAGAGVGALAVLSFVGYKMVHASTADEISLNNFDSPTGVDAASKEMLADTHARNFM